MTLQEFADFFETAWYKKIGLISALVFTTVSLLTILLSTLGVLVTIVFTLIVDVAIVGIWFWSRRPPVTKSNKVGFAICISCSDDKESKKLQEDFIHPLRELIKSGRGGKAIQILQIPPHIASEINDVEQAVALRIKCRAHFMIYGRARLREINEKTVHVLDLEGLVAHTPMTIPNSESFSREFTELMPRKLQISTENDLHSLQFTSEWADIVARYIIGIASAISGDWDYAENLFFDVKDSLHTKDSKFPIYSKLKERIPRRIDEVRYLRIRKLYSQWEKSKNVDYLTQMQNLTNQLTPSFSDSRDVLNFKAILAFILNKDIDTAIDLIKKIKGKGEPAWHLNLAFLFAYQGNYVNAIRHYRIAAELPNIDSALLAQIEDFIVWVLDHEPDKVQLYYLLGFFNWKIKGDLLGAINDFQSFLSAVADNQMQKEKELTMQWISEIQTSLNS